MVSVVKVSQGIMLRGAGLDSLWPAFVVLTGMAAVVFTGVVTGLLVRRSSL